MTEKALNKAPHVTTAAALAVNRANPNADSAARHMPAHRSLFRPNTSTKKIDTTLPGRLARANINVSKKALDNPTSANIFVIQVEIPI